MQLAGESFQGSLLSWASRSGFGVFDVLLLFYTEKIVATVL